MFIIQSEKTLIEELSKLNSDSEERKRGRGEKRGKEMKLTGHVATTGHLSQADNIILESVKEGRKF